MDDFTPEERALIRSSFPLFNTPEKFDALVYFLAIATDRRGRRAIEWTLSFFLAIITVWDGLLVVINFLRWVKTTFGQILLLVAAGGLLYADTKDLWEFLEWLKGPGK